MKIKNFVAANMNEAIALVRQELGSEAIILSNQTVSGQVHLTAALEDKVDYDFSSEDEVETLDVAGHFNDSLLRESLEYHDFLPSVSRRLLACCREENRRLGSRDDRRILEAALNRLFRFSSVLDVSGSKIKMFMGTPGSGKSTAIAKAATQARLKGIKCVIVSTDNVRAGANQQLKAFAEILDVEFFFFKDAKQLFMFCRDPGASYGLVLVDTPGINPFVAAEVDKVAAFAEAVKADKILTMDAGRNVSEAVEVAETFKNLGAAYLLPTRLDLTRRIGTVLSVADCCNLTFCAASVSSSIAKGLADVDAQSLARLILS